jgi:hypothetical protein
VVASFEPVLALCRRCRAPCCLALFVLGGWVGVGLFALQAFIAIWQLELVNYIEHYGLTRKHLGDGKYEHVNRAIPGTPRTRRRTGC